jgi:hypothetical protein
MKILNSLTITLAASVALSGCGFGGGSSGKSGGGSLAAGATVGSITSALPASTRGTNYSFDPLYAPSTVQGGSISAMESSGGDVLVAEAPFSTMNRVDDQGTGTTEATFFFDANAMVSNNGMTWASTGNRQAPGAGDLWERAGSSWSLTLDTSSNELVAAVVSGATLFAAHGSEGQDMTVESRASGAFNSVATINSAVPTAAIGFKGELWIGAADNDSLGGNARLYYGVDTYTEVTNLPIRTVGSGVRQQVTSMMQVTVAPVGSGATTQEFMVLSIGAFSMNTGQPLAGEVLITDGTAYEVIANYNSAAPLALAWADDTIYVGASNGELSYRNDDGTWDVEENVGLNSVSSLVVNGNGDLVVGGTDSAGAAVLLRTGTTGGPPTTTPLFFTTDIAGLLANDCASCHNGALAGASAVYALASPADNVADNTETLTKVDTNAPTASLLLLKAAADSSVGGHGGGTIWATSSTAYATVLEWVNQGANYEATTTPPPPALTTFVDIHAFLAADCNGCHGGGTGGFTANNDIDTTYNSALTKVNSGTPEISALLREPAGIVTHGGGQIALYGQGQAKYNLVLKWIADGTLRQ